MRYEDDIIEEVRAANDIVDVISQYVQLTKKGSSYMGLCPFHNEKTPSFSVSRQGQFFHCFGCGVGGNVFSFVMQYENATFPEAMETLAARAGIRLPEMQYSSSSREKAARRNALLEVNKAAAAFYYYQLRQEAGRDAMAYLTGRGLSGETIHRFGLGYAGTSRNLLYQYLKNKGYNDELLRDSGLFYVDSHGFGDKFFARVMFPIMDVGSRVIGFGGRVMSADGKPKYLNSPETMIFDKGRTLYGLNLAKSSRAGSLILCEGYMDVIAMHQAGFSQAVASLGTALTSGHASLIRRYTQDVLLLYDSDTAGVKAASRAIRILREAGIRSRVVNLRPAKDPDEFIRTNGKEAFLKRLDEALDSFMYLTAQAAAGVSADDPQAVNRFFDEAAALLLELDDELERKLYLNAVVKEYGRFGITADELKKRLTKLAMKGYEPARTAPAAQLPAGPKKKKDPALLQAQKLMLTWLVTWPELFGLTSEYLRPEDFTQPLYREVAGMLYDQYRNGEVNPARLLNAFTDAGEQNEVAALFNASIHLEKGQIGQAYADAVIMIREDNLKQASLSQTQDMEANMKFLDDTRMLQTLKADRKKLAERCDSLLGTDVG